MDASLASVSTSLYGLRRSLEGLRREAHTVAHAAVDGAPADLTGAMVRGTVEKHAFEANAAALHKASERQGTSVDILV